MSARRTIVPAVPPSRATAASTGVTVPAGTSRLTRIIGSQTTVPARSSAAARTSGEGVAETSFGGYRPLAASAGQAQSRGGR